MHTEAFGNEELFLIEGCLSNLQTAHTTQNLLEEIQQYAQAKNLAGGIAAAASDMYGMVANSAALALYDGEDTVNFAGVLGERIVCGTFRDADKMVDGDQIKAVVSKRGDVLYAHSVLCKRRQILMLPLMTFAGEKALFRHCMSVAFWACVFAWVVMGGIFSYLWLTDTKPIEMAEFFFFGGMILVFPPLMMYPMEIWNYRTVRSYGYYASAIFKLLGVPRPDDFDSRKGITMIEDDFIATSFEKALAKHKAKFKIAS